MADLNNLLAELDQPSSPRIEDDPHQEQEQEVEDVVETDMNAEIPHALAEALANKEKDAALTPPKECTQEDAAEDEDYANLKWLWKQEMLCPEILPFDNDTVSLQRELIEGQHDTVDQLFAKATERDSNLASLIASVYKADADRAQYMLSDLLSVRLQKIEDHPRYMREQVDRMSDDEVSFCQNRFLCRDGVVGFSQTLEHRLPTCRDTASS